MKPCNGLPGEILESPALDAFKSRETAARKDKDVADASTDNLNSLQGVCKYYSEEEEGLFSKLSLVHSRFCIYHFSFQLH